MSPLMWVGIALMGGLGAAMRFLVDSWVTARNRLPMPLGTVVVNVSACFLIGLLTGLGSRLPAVAAVAPLLGTGLLGGTRPSAPPASRAPGSSAPAARWPGPSMRGA